jgi:hypothetical protein
MQIGCQFCHVEEEEELAYGGKNCRAEQQEKEVELSRRPRLAQGKVSPRLAVPKEIARPPYVNSKKAPAFLDDYQIQNAEGIERMRASGQLAARVRDYAGTLVKVSFLFYCLFTI